MKRAVRMFVTACVLMLSMPPATAQEADKSHRIGWLFPGSDIGYQGEAFRSGLRELGYAEGRNIIIEWRFANGQMHRFPDLAAELVRLGVDCIVTIGVGATRAAKQATATIPIVMADADDDPVRQGLITSYRRPGGNVTGLVSISSDLAGKRLEFLKETVPGLSLLGILWRPMSDAAKGHFRESEAAARALGIETVSLPLPDIEAVEKAFRDAVSQRAQALLVIGVGGMGRARARIVDLAARFRLPAVYTQRRYVRQGGLMSYAADIVHLRRRAATFVDKVLKGAKPADLPVERPAKFELVVNLETAKAQGISFSRSVLLRADKVFE